MSWLFINYGERGGTKWANIKEWQQIICLKNQTSVHTTNEIAR